MLLLSEVTEGVARPSLGWTHSPEAGPLHPASALIPERSRVPAPDKLPVVPT